MYQGLMVITMVLVWSLQCIEMVIGYLHCLYRACNMYIYNEPKFFSSYYSNEDSKCVYSINKVQCQYMPCINLLS